MTVTQKVSYSKIIIIITWSSSPVWEGEFLSWLTELVSKLDLHLLYMKYIYIVVSKDISVGRCNILKM